MHRRISSQIVWGAAAAISLSMGNLAFAQVGGQGGAGGGTANVGGVGGAGNPALGGAAGGVFGGATPTPIITGPGATGIPLNYSRGAMPGMNQSPETAPSGASNSPGSAGPANSMSNRPNLGRRSRAGGNSAMGRGVGPAPGGGEANPAKTLLDEINGTNNGRRRGHAALRTRTGDSSSEPALITPERVEERAVYFAKKGAYEDMVYHPYQGSYQSQSRSRRPRTAAPQVRRYY
ncbi:MAG TPA: hypothetical protein VHC22_25140 [Pirellulales bacterium]|nr:hypothetical protein [Pirellulales bacterium]